MSDVPYRFDNELEGLRIVLNTETERAYQPFNLGGYGAARPLVIAMQKWVDQFFKGQSIEWKRNKRMQVLGFILGRKVESTNDLSTFQASIIMGYITDERGYLTERGARFLQDCARAAESTGVSQTQLPDFPA